MFCTLLFSIIVLIPFPLCCVEFYAYTESRESSNNSTGNANNSAGNVTILEELNKSSPATCWRSCHGNQNCSAYFENESTNKCRLVSGDASENQVKSEAGWKYVVKSLKQPSCPSYLGFIFDQGANLCIKLLTDTVLSKQDATDLSASIGGRILRIRNDKHQAAVVAYIEKFHAGKNVVIDGTRSDDNSSVWIDSNGEPMTYFHWASGQPVDNGRPYIKLDKNRNLNWSPASSQPKLFLCEIPLDEM